MTRTMPMSRRYLLAGGAGSLALACGGALPVPTTAAATAPGMTPQEEVVRRWYAGWQQPDWAPLDALLTDDFAFSSAAGDDHISKARFKKQCWETQIAFIGQFEIESLVTKGDEVFVRYLCHTRNGKSLRNVERLVLRNDKIASIECYFGAESSFPSAVSKG